MGNASALRPCAAAFLRPTWPTGDSTRGTAQNTPDAPFWPPNGVSGSVTGRTNHGGDSRSFIFRATALKVGWETKMCSNEPGCAFSGPRNARW